MVRYVVEINTESLKYYELSSLGENAFSPINLIQLYKLDFTFTDSLLVIL